MSLLRQSVHLEDEKRMDKQDPAISFLLDEEILDEQTLAAVLEKQAKSGQNLINILKV